MAGGATIASVGTAAGTMVLGLATCAAVRCANRAARVAERSLQVGLRPVLMPSRPEHPPERVIFGDGHAMTVDAGTCTTEERGGLRYLAMALCNVGAGLAVVRGWAPSMVDAWVADY